jgi:hypothetical protein
VSSSAVATRSTRAPAPGSGSAKPNAIASPSRRRVERQLQVVLADDARRARGHAAEREQRLAVGDAERRQARQLLREAQVRDRAALTSASTASAADGRPRPLARRLGGEGAAEAVHFADRQAHARPPRRGRRTSSGGGRIESARRGD